MLVTRSNLSRDRQKYMFVLLHNTTSFIMYVETARLPSDLPVIGMEPVLLPGPVGQLQESLVPANGL